MNKSNIEACQLEQQNNSEQTAQNQQVSQPNANTNVVGSLVGQREIKFRFWLGHTKKMTYDHNLIEIAHMFWDFTEDIISLQYTGLKDKNGKEIYEGDIVWFFSVRHTVIFKDGAFGYNTIEQPNNTYDYFIPFGANGHFEFENNQSNKIIVVGNVFENSELLETLR